MKSEDEACECMCVCMSEEEACECMCVCECMYVCVYEPEGGGGGDVGGG